jgi:Holliday junction resolvase-like predicted endonuclease
MQNTAEKEVVNSLLRLTQNGPIDIEVLQKEVKIPFEIIVQVLHKLSESCYVDLQSNKVEASPSQRIKLAIYTLQLGADIEKVCRYLKWKEFESFGAQAFEANNFQVISNFRFKQANKRWEIDLLGCRQQFIACVDCKHWRHGWRESAIIRVVDAQIERTRAFASMLFLNWDKVGLKGWKDATVIPIILSLVTGPFKFYKKVPIVPVLQLRDFINDMPGEAALLTHFYSKIKFQDLNLTNFIK